MLLTVFIILNDFHQFFMAGLSLESVSWISCLNVEQIQYVLKLAITSWSVGCKSDVAFPGKNTIFTGTYALTVVPLDDQVHYQEEEIHPLHFLTKTIANPILEIDFRYPCLLVHSPEY